MSISFNDEDEALLFFSFLHISSHPSHKTEHPQIVCFSYLYYCFILMFLSPFHNGVSEKYLRKFSHEWYKNRLDL